MATAIRFPSPTAAVEQVSGFGRPRFGSALPRGPACRNPHVSRQAPGALEDGMAIAKLQRVCAGRNAANKQIVERSRRAQNLKVIQKARDLLAAHKRDPELPHFFPLAHGRVSRSRRDHHREDLGLSYERLQSRRQRAGSFGEPAEFSGSAGVPDRAFDREDITRQNAVTLSVLTGACGSAGASLVNKTCAWRNCQAPSWRKATPVVTLNRMMPPNAPQSP